MAGEIDFEFDAQEWREFQRDLKEMVPEVRKAFNKNMKGLLRRIIIPSAKRNASWSRRIPGAIKPQVTARRVGLQVSRRSAPHGRPFEGISGPVFRHPVFGNRDVWVQQPARPFLLPAVNANRERFMQEAGAAIDDAAEETGWS